MFNNNIITVFVYKAICVISDLHRRNRRSLLFQGFMRKTRVNNVRDLPFQHNEKLKNLFLKTFPLPTLGGTGNAETTWWRKFDVLILETCCKARKFNVKAFDGVHKTNRYRPIHVIYSRTQVVPSFIQQCNDTNGLLQMTAKMSPQETKVKGLHTNKNKFHKGHYIIYFLCDCGDVIPKLPDLTILCFKKKTISNTLTYKHKIYKRDSDIRPSVQDKAIKGF